MTMKLRISVTGSCNTRSGVSKAGAPYTMAEAYAHLDGCDFPQKFQYYCQNEHQALMIGEYDVPVEGDVRDGRVVFNVDPRKGVRVQSVSSAPLKQA